MNDGYIKYNCDWIQDNLDFPMFDKLNKLRQLLYFKKLIGCKDNVGYGNISIRKKDGFIITGSTTGCLEILNKNHYTKVTKYDFNKNYLQCYGPIKASSESLSHAAVYDTDENAKCVIHIHNLKLWEQLLNKMPTTSKDAEYGSPKMAKEIIMLVKTSKEKIIIMQGHKEGIIVFGDDLLEAANLIFNYCDNT